MDAADPSSDIIARLESSSDHRGLYRQFCSFLLPFGDVIALDAHDPAAAASRQSSKKGAASTAQGGGRKKKAAAKKEAEIDAAGNLRSLAKRYLPFLSRILKLLPVILRKCTGRGGEGGGGGDDDGADELFGVYRLALDCLQFILPCLAGKPYSVHLQRSRLVCCLETCGRYAEAEGEALGLLENLVSVVGPAKPRRGKASKASGQFLPPSLDDGADDPELAVLLIEVVTSLAGCAFKSKLKNGAVYERVLTLFDELQPWLRLMDREALEKYQTVLMNALYKCSIFLATESLSFDANLVQRFCMLVYRGCSKSPLKDQLPKISRRICSSFGSKCETGHFIMSDMLRSLPEFMLCECKGGVVCNINDFFEFLCYCAETSAGLDLSRDVSRLVYDLCKTMQVLPVVTSILDLYAVGLYFSISKDQEKFMVFVSRSSNGSVLAPPLDSGVDFQLFAKSLSFLASSFNVLEQHIGLPVSTAVNDPMDKLFLDQVSSATKVCMRRHGEVSFLSYFNALEFSCKILEEVVTRAWKHTVSPENIMHFSPNTVYVLEMFHQLCDLYFTTPGSRYTSEKKENRLHESHAVLIHAAIAALRISLGLGRKQEKSVGFINNLITSKWIKLQELKFLVSSLYNSGASLYNIKQSDKACVAFRLCCSAVWTHVRCLSNIYLDEPNIVHVGNSSEDAIKDVVMDALAKSAVTLDVLHQCRDANLQDVIVKSLSSWAVASNTLKGVITPTNLVKQWVKIACKEFEANGDDKALALYPLLSSSCRTMSKKILGLILEQELLAYEEMTGRYSNLCQTMKLKIVDILLVNVYATEEYSLQRANMLVRKAKALRAPWIEGLSSCIQCLSEAISLFDKVSGGSIGKDASLNHQLAITYCLHAQCVQEANQDLKVIMHDVRSALELWSHINFAGGSISDDHFDLLAGNTIQLLCNISDLMSMKGCLDFQYGFFKLIILFWQLKKEQLEKCFSMLWTDRRLNHALCSSPVNNNFIGHLSKDLGLHATSIDFWIGCLKDVPASITSLLQKFLLSDFIQRQACIYYSGRLSSYNVTVEEVENIASSLVSSVSVSSQSAFAAAYLYYDLAERLCFNGRLSEALRYAKEALQLRRKILQRKFIYLFKQQSAETEKHEEKTCDDNYQVYLEAVGLEITNVWPDSNASPNLEHSIVSPWNALGSYLESSLQVGTVLELIGDGDEAEVFLLIGKKISKLQGFPLSEISFKCLLGQIYCKKQLWDLAKDELDGVKVVLGVNENSISCKFCKLSMEVTTDMLIADISRSLSENSSKIHASENMFDASGLYRSAFEKLTSAKLEDYLGICTNTGRVGEIKNGSVIIGQGCQTDVEPRSFLCHNCDRTCLNMESHFDEPKTISADMSLSKVEDEPKHATRGAKRRCRNSAKLLPSEEYQNSGRNITKTRSNKIPLCSEIQHTTNSVDCSFSTTNCWACHLVKVTVAGSIQDIIHLKWECHRRRVLLKLLSRIVRCSGANNQDHDAHVLFSKSMSMLFEKNPYHQTYSAAQHSSMPELIGDDFVGDNFSMERAAVLYDMSWFFAKNCLSETPRAKCCFLSSICLSTVISWLLRAFMLTNEVPLFFEKVAQLLATLFLLSTLGGQYALPPDITKSLSAAHWAAYFHQASVGTCIHHQYLSMIKGKSCYSVDKSQCTDDSEGTTTAASFLPRIVPEKLSQLEDFVRNFFLSLPDFSCICVSFLEGDYINIVGEALVLPSFLPAWMLISRLESDEQPITLVLPIDFIAEESSQEDTNSYSGLLECNEAIRSWDCPWGHTVVDYVAPHFKLMLEENYLSLSNMTSTSVDTQKGRFIWWSQRTKLNNRLSKFLRNMENSWLGVWRCLFLGKRSHSEELEALMIKLIDDLHHKYKFETNLSLLKVIVDCSSSLSEAEECISQLLLYGGYFGRGECCGEGRFRAFSTAGLGSEDKLQLIRLLILETVGSLLEESVVREPLILVLDAGIQMLPWENLPVLRKQEVYRMPSVASISATLGRNCNRKGVKQCSSHLPLVDPLDTYYLLNPSGDLSNTQVEFEEWFRNQNWEGKAGNAPTAEELVAALKSHDLFLYFGHGSGTQYIPGHEIQKLNKCAATLLMGCSSGCLSLKGCYFPQGAPLSYLFAGSPAIIANLWEVTDKDIDRFGKAMLNSWLLEESNLASCAHCNRLVEQLGCLNIDVNGNKRSLKARKVTRSKRMCEVGESDCSAKNRIASCMSEARDVCKLPLLIGASPVCYGIPTVVKKKQSS